MQAAFVNYGKQRHGFLAFNDIQSDYYQIPHDDKDRLQREEENLRLELKEKSKEEEIEKPNQYLEEKISQNSKSQNSDDRLKASPLVKIIAKENNLFVIEDASHAHGAIYRNSKIGSFGDITCFSFYPSKNLGCMGDGGAITTNNKDLYERIKLMRTYGESEKFHHTELGYNKRLDNLQAGILNVKLTHLDQWNNARQNAAKIYNDLLDSILNIPEIQSDRTSVFYVYSINSTNRDQLQEFLTTKNIQTSIHYPIPIHKQKLFVDLGYSDKLPVTEQLANETLSLPMFPLITEDEIHYISRQIIEFYGTI